MITVYDHPEYQEPGYLEEETPIKDLLFPDPSIVYEELYPSIPDEEFNFMQMMFKVHLDEMIREHEEEEVL